MKNCIWFYLGGDGKNTFSIHMQVHNCIDKQWSVRSEHREREWQWNCATTFAKAEAFIICFFLAAETPVKMERKHWVAVLKSSLSVQSTSWSSGFFFYNQACTLMLILKSSVMMFHSYMKIFFIYEMGLKFFPSPVTSSNSFFICRPEFLRSLLRTTKSCTTKFSYDSKENLQTVVMITRFACG